MCGDDRVAEARADHVVRLGSLLLKQVTGPEQAAEFLIVGEMQLNVAVQLGAGRFAALSAASA